MKLWLDTDIGDDVDDAFALAFALAHGGCSLVGVSTVYCDPVLRARLAKKLISLYKKDVPVYAGYAEPLGRSAGFISFTQTDPDLGASRYAPQNSRPEEAVDALISAAEKYGGELVVGAIGPYTNVARAVLKAPDVMRRVRYVLMGGSFSETFKEWNIVCDLEASRILFRSGLDLTAVGIDVTRHAVVPEGAHKRIMEASLPAPAAYLRELIRMWGGGERRPILHDPYAIATTLEPELFQMAEEEFYLETKGEIAEGIFFKEEQINSFVRHEEVGAPVRYCKQASADAMRLILTTIFGNIFQGGTL